MEPRERAAPRVLLVHVNNRRRIPLNLSGIYPMLPLGLAMLGAQLRRDGVPVELLDLGLPAHHRLDLVRKVREGGFQIVSCSATVFSLPEVVRITTALKQALPEVQIVLGGPCTVFEPATLFEYLPGVDVVVRGEGERALSLLCRAYGDPAELRKVPGAAFRENGRVVENPPAPPLPMDELPYPARDLLPRGIYGMHPPFNRYPPVTLIESARGCPHDCRFCSLPREWRARSIPHVIGEIRQVIAEEGIREVHFVDPTFTADQERTFRLAEALRPLGIRFTCKTRVDLVTPELLAALRAAGCYMISYGVETLDPGNAEYLNKSTGGVDGAEVIRMTRAAGIDVLAYMLIGNPHDTLRSVLDTTAALLDAGCDYALFSDLFPDPATELTRAAIAAGRVTERQISDFYFREIPLPGEENLSGLPVRRVRRWVLLAFVRFYFSARTIRRQLARQENLRQLGHLLMGTLHVLRDIGRSLAFR